MRSTRKYNSVSKSKSGSLPVVEYTGKYQPVPLKIYHADSSAQVHLRRSPRFSKRPQNGDATDLKWSELKMWDERTLRKSLNEIESPQAKGLRRSPRLVSARVADIGLGVSGSGSGASGSRTRKEKSCLGKLQSTKSTGEQLRRSPIFAETEIGAGVRLTNSDSHVVKRQRSRTQELSLNGGTDLDKSEAKCFRRSPRLASGQPARENSCPKKPTEQMFGSPDHLRAVQRKNSTLYSDAKLKPLSRHKESTMETLPLKHCDSQFIGEKRLRRSPRLNSSTKEHGSDVYTEILHVKPLDARKVRRSPRLTSSSGCENLSDLISSTRKHGSEAPMRNPDVKLSGVKFRRSPRLSSSSGSENLSDLNSSTRKHGSEVPMRNPNVKQLEGVKFRRFPRLSSSSGNEDTTHVNSSTRKHVSEASMESRDIKLLDGMKFGRSSRLSSSSGNENLEIDPVEKETSKIIDQKRKNSRVNYTSVELNEQHLMVTATSGNSEASSPDSKSLRTSSETITSASGVENGRINCDSFSLPESDENPPRKKFKTTSSLANGGKNHKSIASFIGDPIPDDEAQKRWGWRYELKNKNSKKQISKINDDEEDEIIINVECHYAQAKVGDCIFNLGDCAYIEGEGERKHVGKIIEFFQTTKKANYFRVQWFYRIDDTVVQDEGTFHDKRRLFYSSIMNDNLLGCIIAKAKVTYISPRVGLKLTSIPPSDFYYDMEYCVEYSTFRSMPTDNSDKSCESSTVVLETLPSVTSAIKKNKIPSSEMNKAELSLLDIYSGCGGMSTGLCLGAKVSSVNLVTRWAVDSDKSACESLKINHPETRVINESAEEFLELLKEWEKLCRRHKVSDVERGHLLRLNSTEEEKEQDNSDSDNIPDGEYEVSRLVDICYGDPSEAGRRGLYFKVHWKGYSANEDTWEHIKDLSKCQEKIQDFVRDGMKSKILPLPGDVDVICGGPPCQGISGYNRFRNTESPLDDERNRQIVVFMDIVKFLKPKYVLMENVVDILKFDKASLGRYALSRLVHLRYQARLGIIAAGCYGLPQFRLRVFLWGAQPSEVLPQFPLPTHEVIIRYWPPILFERNTVAYDENQPRELEKAVVLRDAISDLPAVTNDETREEMSYQDPPETELQRYIRSTEYEMTGSTLNGTTEKRPILYDHRAYLMHEDDCLRVCQIPKQKGANFRDLPGVIVGADNVARRDPKVNPLLPSGKLMVPDYCFTFDQGKSKRPFGRLWWDETVPTVLTYPTCHNQVVLHPEQDRVLTIREFARLQGFPDYYRFCGTVKERYCQIGNAVAVSVSRALGYALGKASRNLAGNAPLMTLPAKFSLSNNLNLSNNQLVDAD
ncbi:hypothetical protein L6164_020396 [Bauhinia variegata]|uniref:Uncharacterized protein n=1 Tax=Bauhinia variegata TaxID=167791 RepID=A0ACB9MVD5_BAUVA|nr:hypothetical protein L6164_020396 [Bauhinia variegata]